MIVEKQDSKIPDFSKIPYPHPEQESNKEKTLADSLQQIQTYYPIHDLFLDLTESNYQDQSIAHPYQIYDLHSVIHNETKKIVPQEVFIKYSPLLDPIKYMVGKYDVNQANLKLLPKFASTECNSKIMNPMNASYTDTFFCYLSSMIKHKYGFKHGIDFYGTYLAIQDRYKMNVEEDMEYLSNSPYFAQNLGKYMVLENYDMSQIQHSIGNGSRGMKQKVEICQDEEDLPLDLGIIEIDSKDQETEFVPQENTESTEVVYEKVQNKNSSISSSDSSDTEACLLDGADEDEPELDIESDQEDDDLETDEDDDLETDEESCWESIEDKETHAYIFDFPVQLICLEKCKGTLDELFESKIPTNEYASALFQIIMILITYQKMFKFTHNDLHTNNIMYVETDEPFLYYKYNDKYYKVPTYGRIFKIIDYGRAIYKFQNKIFCSDSFASGGDAVTQYNCEPFIKESKPILEPNPSFDLCRLGVSIYDFIFDSDQMTKNEMMKKDDLQRIVQRWCTDDYQRNVLYKKNGEERYPGFRLYKMIARTVHDHKPDNQLNDSWFSSFLVPGPTNQNDVMDIDSYPTLY